MLVTGLTRGHIGRCITCVTFDFLQLIVCFFGHLSLVAKLYCVLCLNGGHKELGGKCVKWIVHNRIIKKYPYIGYGICVHRRLDRQYPGHWSPWSGGVEAKVSRPHHS